jgi:hypothetical protein
MGRENPVGRKSDLIVQEHDKEILIYDLQTNQAFCLNETSSNIWRACDGTRSIAEIANSHGGEDVVWLALRDLKENRLLEDSTEIPNRFHGMSRREVIKKVGLGTMVALPVIASLIAPTAAHAASCTATADRNQGCPCSPPNGAQNQCAPGLFCRNAGGGGTCQP